MSTIEKLVSGSTKQIHREKHTSILQNIQHLPYGPFSKLLDNTTIKSNLSRIIPLHP